MASLVVFLDFLPLVFLMLLLLLLTKVGLVGVDEGEALLALRVRDTWSMVKLATAGPDAWKRTPGAHLTSTVTAACPFFLALVGLALFLFLKLWARGCSVHTMVTMLSAVGMGEEIFLFFLFFFLLLPPLEEEATGPAAVVVGIPPCHAKLSLRRPT